MTWSIVEVARMSGVTSRALRHYDAIGLLPPTRIGANGYRHYGEAELLRLQRILVLRELGVGLGEIAAVLAAETDEVAALRAHHERLLAERSRLDRLAATVARTIAELERESARGHGGEHGRDREHGHGHGHGRKDDTMARIHKPETLFEGFDPAAHEAEAAERWPEQWAWSKQYTDTLGPDDMSGLRRESAAHIHRMADLMTAGATADDDVVLAEVDVHYRFVSRFWTPDAAAYTGLGEMFAADERWRATYDGVADGLAEFIRDAMAAYARGRMD